MNRITVIILMTAACAAFAYAGDALEVLPRLGITHYDETDDGFFTSMAGVPLFVFHHDGSVYQSPYLTDDLDDTANYFLEDFAAYIDTKGGAEQLVFIGDVPAGTRSGVEALFPDAHVATFEGDDVPTVARGLSTDWSSADAAVIAIYEAPADNDVRLAVANAAAAAGYLNVPLLFVENDSVPGDTLAALDDLGADEVYIIDPGNLIGTSAENELTDAGITITENLTTIQDVVSFMRDLSGIVSMNTFTDFDQTLAAAISSARYGGFCVELDLSAAEEVNRLDGLIMASLPDMPTEKFTVGEWEPPEWLPSGESGIANDFADWLDYLGAEDPAQLEWVTFFGPKSDTQVYLERAIVGDPDEPDERGCLPGRMPGTPARNVVYANRSALYPAVVFANPFYDRVIYAYNSFVCHYADQGPLHSGAPYTNDFEDNDGIWRRVNEIFGVPEFYEGGFWEAFDDAGYEYGCHAGAYEGTYMDDDEHPFNPPGQPLDGFIEYINDGAMLYYYSGHGNTSYISASRTDIGLNEEEPWGHPYWPSDDGAITGSPPGSGYSQGEWNSDLENVHSMVSTWDTCLVGASMFNEYTMRHGGAGAMSSYISVSWEGSGWYWSVMGEKITEGLTMAECFGHANATTTYIFPQGEYDGDGSLYYLWYGDPFMVMYQPGWTSPDPADLGADYGGHTPGDFLDVSVTDFKAEAINDHVKLTWKVADGSAAGFNLYRSVEADTDGAGSSRTTENRVNDAPITGSSPFAYWDEDVTTGVTYAYVLEAIDAAGAASRFGPVTVTVGEGDVPMAFALAQSRPNPSSGSATIAFAVPHESKITLTVYDISGRRVETVADEVLPAGTYEREVSGLAPGVYIYRLEADSFSAARKMVVVR